MCVYALVLLNKLSTRTCLSIILVRRNNMHIRLRVKEILEEKGKSNYWLSQKLGMCYRNYHNLVTNQTTAIRFETMEKLCEILEVPVTELFDQIDDNEE